MCECVFPLSCAGVAHKLGQKVTVVTPLGIVHNQSNQPTKNGGEIMLGYHFYPSDSCRIIPLGKSTCMTVGKECCSAVVTAL